MRAGPLRMEFFKLKKSPLFVVLFLLLLAAIKIVVLLAGGESAEQPGSAYVFLAKSAAISTKVWWFLLICLAAASLSGEHSRGILRMQLSRPVGRTSYFLAKLIAHLAAAFLLLCADAAVGTGLAALFRDFGDVADPALQGPQFAAVSMAWGVAESYALTFLGIAATLALGFFFSVLWSGPTPAVACAAGAGMVMEGVRVTLTQSDTLRYYLISWYNFIHFDRLVKLAQGYADFTPHGFGGLAVGIPLVFVAVLTAAAVVIFHRTDISS